MVTRRFSAIVLTVSIALGEVACNGGDGFMAADTPVSTTDAAATDGNRADVARDVTPADSRPVSTVPLLLALEPDHGPFNGGTSVTLRGSNLSADLIVKFGTAMVQPRNEMLTDSHRLVVLSPSGEPGTVDVSIDNGTQHSTLSAAYTYDAFYADPNSGSVAGGTLIDLHGENTNWTSATTVVIDSTPCGNITFVSPNEITCVAPVHAQGKVPITVTTGAEAITVGEGFNYYDGASTTSGGFGGGHVAGSINVAVFNQLTGDPIPGAFVYLGTDPTVLPPNSGITNTSGEITLSSPGLTGPVTITASAHCFASSTFISIDGRDANISLLPWLNQVPGVDCGPPPTGNPDQRPPIYAAQISGEIVWSGPMEFGPNPWYNVPLPNEHEQRVAFVMTTQDTIFGSNPDPGQGGTVMEVIPPDYGGRGYAYSIVARPAALAVYAIAGLQRTDVTPATFVPYVMGVTRGILASPRAQLTVDVDMDIPLDHETQVIIHDLPGQLSSGLPDQLRVEGWTDLGGEGVIPRPDVTVFGNSVADPYLLEAQPAFDRNLADARMIVRAMYESGNQYSEPESTVIITGIQTPDLTVDVGNWVGIPVLTSPTDGGMIAANRQVTFDLTGHDPDFFWTMISESGSSCRNGVFLGDVVWWQHQFAGTGRSFVVPDISMIPTLTDIPHGSYQLSLCAIHVPGFDYNNFRYDYLSQYYWTSFASNVVSVVR